MPQTLDELSEDIAALMISKEWSENDFLGEQIEMIFNRIEESGWTIAKKEP